MTNIAVKPDAEKWHDIPKQGKDVLFAYMPYHQLSHPALGASILKTCLTNRGITTQISYYGMKFAENIGAKQYEQIKNSEATRLLGEWTFANAAFGEGFKEKQELELGKSEFDFNEMHYSVAEAATEWINHEAKKIQANPPKILICSSMFQQNMASLAILRKVKEYCPDIITIMGGPNTEGELGPALLRRAPWLDYISAGEGEETLPELCLNLLSQNDTFEWPVGVIGKPINSLQQPGKNHVLARAVLQSMDDSPEPSFDDYFEDLKKTSLNIVPGLLLESSRGCWWGQRSQCTFCGLNGEGMSYRAKSPEQMANIVKKKTKEHKIKKIEFVDNIIAKNYFDSFLPLLEKQDLSLFYETKADFSEHDAQQFLKSGVRFIQPGIESLNDNVLKLMRKGTSAAINIECLRLCREYGLRPAWSILSDFPGEEEEWYRESMELLPKIYHLQPPSAMIKIRFDRFSPYHDNPADWNLDLVPFDAYRYIYPASEHGHDDIAYFFKKRGELDNRKKMQLAQAEIYQSWRQHVRNWQIYWQECKKNKQSLPQLTLEREGGNHVIIDTRQKGQKEITTVSDSMVALITYCRARKSHSVMKREDHVNKFGRIEDSKGLLHAAIKNDWIINTSKHLLSVIQIKNTAQPALTDWPGGSVIRD